MRRSFRRCSELFSLVYFNPKTSMTNVKLIGCALCRHSPNVAEICYESNGSRKSNNWYCVIRPNCSRPYITFLVSAYTYPMCTYWSGLYWMQNSPGIVFSSKWIYLYRLMEYVLRWKNYIYAHISRPFIWNDGIPVEFYRCDVCRWGYVITWILY